MPKSNLSTEQKHNLMIRWQVLMMELPPTTMTNLPTMPSKFWRIFSIILVVGYGKRCLEYAKDPEFWKSDRKSG